MMSIVARDMQTWWYLGHSFLVGGQYECSLIWSPPMNCTDLASTCQEKSLSMILACLWHFSWSWWWKTTPAVDLYQPTTLQLAVSLTSSIHESWYMWYYFSSEEDCCNKGLVYRIWGSTKDINTLPSQIEVPFNNYHLSGFLQKAMKR